MSYNYNQARIEAEYHDYVEEIKKQNDLYNTYYIEYINKKRALDYNQPTCIQEQLVLKDKYRILLSAYQKSIDLLDQTIKICEEMTGHLDYYRKAIDYNTKAMLVDTVSRRRHTDYYQNTSFLKDRLIASKNEMLNSYNQYKEQLTKINQLLNEYSMEQEDTNNYLFTDDKALRNIDETLVLSRGEVKDFYYRCKEIRIDLLKRVLFYDYQLNNIILDIIQKLDSLKRPSDDYEHPSAKEIQDINTRNDIKQESHHQYWINYLNDKYSLKDDQLTQINDLLIQRDMWTIIKSAFQSSLDSLNQTYQLCKELLNDLNEYHNITNKQPSIFETLFKQNLLNNIDTNNSVLEEQIIEKKEKMFICYYQYKDRLNQMDELLKEYQVEHSSTSNYLFTDKRIIRNIDDSILLASQDIQTLCHFCEETKEKLLEEIMILENKREDISKLIMTIAI